MPDTNVQETNSDTDPMLTWAQGVVTYAEAYGLNVQMGVIAGQHNAHTAYRILEDDYLLAVCNDIGSVFTWITAYAKGRVTRGGSALNAG